MKKQIEETLQCLIGLSFWGAGRVANLLTFQFGPRHVRTDRHGKSYEVGAYQLHVQCAWHIAKVTYILAASRDRHFEPDDENEEMSNNEGEAYAWAKSEKSLLDERLLSFFQECEKTPVFVQAIRADDLGGLTIELSYKLTLTVFPDHSSDGECWRFFQASVDSPHFVITGAGIEDQEE